MTGLCEGYAWKTCEEAFQDGARAYADGERVTSGPWEPAQHPSHPQHDLWEAWVEGWEDARDHDDNP